MFQNHRKFLFESGIVILVGFLSFFFRTEKDYIFSDGIGYYEYLPSAFIHHDLSRTSNEIPIRIQSTLGYTKYNNGAVNKYHCGTAVLLTPFFLVAKFLYYEPGMTGYEWPFHVATLIAALFYTLLTLIFVRKLLELYAIKWAVIALTQTVLIFATNALFYIGEVPTFSHLYSLFAITALLFCTRHCLVNYQRRYVIWVFLLLGLIVIIRPINIMIILFLPFMSDSWQQLRARAIDVLRDTNGLAFSLVALCVPLAIQVTVWYLQTGDFIVYSYGTERFYFTDPHMRETLFSFRKGLFIYTPILLFSLLGLLRLIRDKKWYSIGTFLVPTTLLTYVISSWWDWSYGCSYGHRVYIDFFSLLFIPFAIGANDKSWSSKIPWIAAIVFIPINLIQTWQYKQHILHWYTMDFDKYATVFLKTSDPYKGFLWKEDVSPEECNTLREFDFGMKQVLPATADTLMNIPFRELALGSDLHTVEISCRNEFSEDSKALIELNIMDSTGTKILWTRGVYLIQFADRELNSIQHGHYWYKPNIIITDSYRILIRVFGGDETTQLDDVKIRFCN